MVITQLDPISVKLQESCKMPVSKKKCHNFSRLSEVKCSQMADCVAHVLEVKL